MRIVLGSIAMLTLSVLACSSANSSNLGLLEPEFRIRKQEGQMIPRTDVDTDIALQIDVFNQSSERITLERIRLRTTPTSDVQYRQAERQLSLEIPAGEVRTVELWVVATLVNARADERSPVTVRGTAIFRSELGEFRSVFLEPVQVYDASTAPRD